MREFKIASIGKASARILLAAILVCGAWSIRETSGASAAESHDHEGHAHSDDEADQLDDSGHAAEAGEAAGHHENSVHLSHAQMHEFGVETGTAGPGRITTYVVLPGEVLPNADRIAHLVPRYAGIVKEVRARVGDTVAPGDVLAVVESSETLAPYELKTLLGGTVIAKHITRGEAVTRDTQAFVIADLNDVWIELSVYQRDLARIGTGQRVLVSSGHHLPDIEGTIAYVSPILDEDTRTARARIVMANANGEWRPGMFVTGRVAVNAVDVAIAVPQTALENVEGRTVVFVREGEEFEARAVKLGRMSTTHAEVLSGLQTGEPYVTKGGFVLKAELGRSELGEGHSH